MTSKPDAHAILIAELERQPLTEVSGVLAPGGMAGASSGDTERPWILQFTFLAWKLVGGNIQNRELAIRKLVGENELRSSMGRFEPYEIIRIHARVAEQNSYGKPQALLDAIVDKDPDATDLKKRALELQEPVTFEDQRFGVFTLDRRIDWYEAVVPWGPVEIRLTLSPWDGGDVKACLPTARAIWDSQPVWQARIADYIVTQLLSLKNDSWLGEDETEFSAEAFKSRLTLTSVNVEANGNFEFWYDDGDLFWGHSIRVDGSLSKGPTSAGIEG